MQVVGAANVWLRIVSSVGRGLLTVVVACTAIFILLASLPGDAATAAAGANQAAAEQLRQQHGLDDPVLARLANWWHGVITGDFGSSYLTGRDVLDVVIPALVRTLWVAIPAWCVAVLLGWLIAAMIAWWHGTTTDQAANMVVGVSVGLPEAVWVASLTFVVAVWWGVLPAVSLLPPGTAPMQVPHLLILPGLCLTVPATAWMVRLLRGVAEDVANSPTVRTAQQRRTPFGFALWHMMMRPMGGAVAQVAAALAVVLLGGSVIVESMLSYDGIGRVLAGALQQRDVPVVMGATILITALGAIALVLADLIATNSPGGRRPTPRPGITGTDFTVALPGTAPPNAGRPGPSLPGTSQPAAPDHATEHANAAAPQATPGGSASPGPASAGSTSSGAGRERAGRPEVPGRSAAGEDAAGSDRAGE